MKLVTAAVWPGDTCVVDPRAADLRYRASRVGFDALRRAWIRVPQQAVNERRVIERNEHALRTILEKPAAALVVLVVAPDKIGDDRIRDALALDQPVAAPVERQPAIDGRDIRPLGHSLLDDFVHDLLEMNGEQDRERVKE